MRPENATFAIEDETKSLIFPTPRSCFCFHLPTPPCPHQRRVPNLMHPDFCSFSCWPFHFSDGADGLKPWTPYLEPSTLNPFIRVWGGRLLTNLSLGVGLPYPKAKPASSVAYAILTPPHMRVAQAAFHPLFCLHAIKDTKLCPRLSRGTPVSAEI